jgi:serine/threonine-protein kinase
MRTIVANRYLIGALLEYNGDGASYMSWDIERKTQVVVREFIPDNIAVRDSSGLGIKAIPGMENIFRDCMAGFLDLWRKLARMRGLSSLILVIDIVEDYGTAYAVSEHMECVTFRDYLLSSTTGYISWSDARALFMPVLSTLATLHSAGIVHRGISPTTLLIGKDKKMRISGFSIPQVRSESSDLNPELFSGYAAIEQYEGFNDQQGPWTDIYAFAAVIYRSLIGSTPLDAASRATNDKMMIPGRFAEQIPAYVINALINALQILPADRIKNVDDFRNQLSASPSAVLSNTSGLTQLDEKPKPQPVREKAKKNTTVSTALKAGAIFFAACILIFMIVWFALLKDRSTVGPGNTTGTTVSKTKTHVPDFEGLTFEIVSNERLYTTNFTFVKVEEFSETVKSGYIISQNIAAGTEVEIGSEIQLVVSKGVTQIEFADVTGKTYEEANNILTALGFVCSRVDKENTGEFTGGTVASANRNAGTKYDKGTKVILQVWTEKKDEESD